MNSVVTESIIQSIVETASKGKVEKKAGKRVGFNYIIVKSYKESPKNDVVKCIYIKSLTDFGFCVIKEGSYGDSRDKDGRDIIDRLKWQKQLHEELQDKVPMPKLIGQFEEGGNYYLVIEHIRGKALQSVNGEKRKELRQSFIDGGKLGRKFLDYLIQIAEILEKLHAHNIVHRDATPNNYMITPGGKVALIDMELCYSIKTQYPTPAFALGTYGYMSKQQETISIPTTTEDIFAFGAIMFQIYSGIAPGRLTGDSIEELARKIRFFIPDQEIADLVYNCLSPDNQLCPDASQILHVLTKHKNNLNSNLQRNIVQPVLYSPEQIKAAVQEGISALATPLFSDEDKGWFSDDMKPPKEDEKHKLRKTWYASFSHGASGVIYFLTQAKRAGLDISPTLPFIQKGIDLIKLKYIDLIELKKPGIHFGSDGIAAVLSNAIKENLIETSVDYLEWIGMLLQKPGDQDSFVNGLAGQGFANLASTPFLNQKDLKQRLENYANSLIAKQHDDGSWSNGYNDQNFTKRKIRKISKGFMDGMSGTICYLLEFGYRYKHKESILAAQRGLNYIIKKARHKKGATYWLSSKGKEMSYGLSNGTSGLTLCLIRGFQHTNNPLYKKYAVAALRGIPESITDSSISQAGGLAGLGEVYLEAYKTFKDEEWLNRAGWLAQVIMHQQKQHVKHGGFWLVESERQPVANFMIGCTGVLHFLLRFCYPNQINFPLLAD